MPSARPRRHRAAGGRAEDHDRGFAGTRLAKIRRPLAGKKPRDRSERAERVSTVTDYKQQSASYDAETDEIIGTNNYRVSRPGCAGKLLRPDGLGHRALPWPVT